MNKINIDYYNKKFKNEDLHSVFNFFQNDEKLKIKFSSSFGLEDQVITHMIYKYNINIFTLDTGRLHSETYNLMDETKKKFNLDIDIYFPNNEDIQNLYKKQGVNGFYNSIDNRKECCYLRKIKPLKNALKNVDIWITGLRANQSITRQNMKMFEYDETFNLIKFNPLIFWSLSDVWNYINKNNIIYNKLHNQGYLSIGCEPCTKSIQDNEDIRSGRWWWEKLEHKECGLHSRKIK